MKYQQAIRGRAASAFTLLEMVIVLGIIAVLLGSSISLISGIKNGAQLQRVATDFRAIDSALKTYQINSGHYPTTSQGLQALVTRPSAAPLPSKWAQVLKKLPSDPWEQPYGYKFPGSKNPAEFELISKGPDGQEGSEDDINSQDD